MPVGVVTAGLPTLVWVAQQRGVAREGLYMPPVRCDLRGALSAAIRPALEVKEGASQPRDFILMVQAAAGLAALGARFNVSPTWRQPIVHSGATRLEARDTGGRRGVIGVCVGHGVPAGPPAGRGGRCFQ